MAKNYLETGERLFLNNTLLLLENQKTEEITLDEKQITKLEKILEKYKKYV